MSSAAADLAGAPDRIYLETQEATVRHLGELYTIVVGISLSSAIGDMFAQEGPSIERDLAAWALLAGFVVTLIPYYHGTLRHLDRYHRPPRPAPAHRGALLVDFGFIFLQGCLFFALAKHIAQPRDFGAILWVLLFSNVAWLVVTRLVFFREVSSVREAWRRMRESPLPDHRVPRHWLLNNLVFIGLLAVGLWGARPETGCADAVVAALVAPLCLFRTWRDYQTAWPFYFPEQPGQNPSAAVREATPPGWETPRA
jgi:hypothetical protein